MILDPRNRCATFGALDVIDGIKDALAIVHGPEGCSWHLRMFSNFYRREELRVYDTGFSEKEVIFGGEEGLRKAIIEADKRFGPRLITVLSSCSSDVIGEDIKEIASKVSRKIKAELVAVNSKGYANHFKGYEECLKEIVSLVEKPKESLNSVNVLGFSNLDLRARSNLEEMKRILNGSGIEIGCIFGNCSIGEIKKARSAKLNVVLSHSALEAAKDMEERLGMPYILAKLPMGMESTKNWISSIAKELGLKVNGFAKKEEEMVRRKMRNASLGFGGLSWISEKHTAVFIEDYQTPLLDFLDEFKVQVDILGIFTDSPRRYGDALINPNIIEIKEALKGKEIELIFGSTLDRYAAREVYGHFIPCVRTSYPVYDEIVLSHRPNIGFKGAICLIEEAINENLRYGMVK
jgi:nitrogenase molybdenum-cofactor synthesis protein NifE